jgi:hypothetical protein
MPFAELGRVGTGRALFTGREAKKFTRTVFRLSRQAQTNAVLRRPILATGVKNVANWQISPLQGAAVVIEHTRSLQRGCETSHRRP